MNYSDPTANRAIGAINREWEDMLCLAYKLRTNPQLTNPTIESEMIFRGIYSRFLFLRDIIIVNQSQYKNCIYPTRAFHYCVYAGSIWTYHRSNETRCCESYV